MRWNFSGVLVTIATFFGWGLTGYNILPVSGGVIYLPFFGLRDRKLDIHHATMAQHHDKKAQSPLGRSHGHRTFGSPIDLGTFPRGKREFQKGFCFRRPDGTYVVLDDGVSRRQNRFDRYAGKLAPLSKGVVPTCERCPV